MKNKKEEKKPGNVLLEDWECLNPTEQNTRLAAGTLTQKPVKSVGKKNPRAEDERFGYELLVGVGIVLLIGIASLIAWFLWAVVLSTPAHPG